MSPDAEQRGWRAITRGKQQLVRDRVRLQNQLEAVLEEARIKLSSVISDLLGVSGPRILQALADGETDPDCLAGLGDDPLRCSQQELADALNGSKLGYKGAIWAIAHRLGRLLWKSSTTRSAISNKDRDQSQGEETPRPKDSSQTWVCSPDYSHSAGSPGRVIFNGAYGTKKVLQTSACSRRDLMIPATTTGRTNLSPAETCTTFTRPKYKPFLIWIGR